MTFPLAGLLPLFPYPYISEQLSCQGNTIDPYGDGLISYELSDNASASIEHISTINAEGGQVLVTTAAAHQAMNSLINLTGVISADSIGSQTGSIVIKAKGMMPVIAPH